MAFALVHSDIKALFPGDRAQYVRSIRRSDDVFIDVVLAGLSDVPAGVGDDERLQLVVLVDAQLFVPVDALLDVRHIVLAQSLVLDLNTAE